MCVCFWPNSRDKRDNSAKGFPWGDWGTKTEKRSTEHGASVPFPSFGAWGWGASTVVLNKRHIENECGNSFECNCFGCK